MNRLLLAFISAAWVFLCPCVERRPGQKACASAAKSVSTMAGAIFRSIDGAVAYPCYSYCSGWSITLSVKSAMRRRNRWRVEISKAACSVGAPGKYIVAVLRPRNRGLLTLYRNRIPKYTVRQKPYSLSWSTFYWYSSYVYKLTCLQKMYSFLNLSCVAAIGSRLCPRWHMLQNYRMLLLPMYLATISYCPTESIYIYIYI